MKDKLDRDLLLVCIDSNPFALVLLQKAMETAQSYDCDLHAIYIETSKHYKLDEKTLSQLKRNISKAERMGIIIHQVTGVNIAQTVINFANENNFKKIFVGVSPRNEIARIFKPSLHQALVRNKYNIEINALPLPKKKTKAKLFSLITERQNLIGYLVSAIIISLITLVGQLMNANGELIGYNMSIINISMVLLLGVLFSAIRFSFLTGLVAALLGFVSLNFFFLKPALAFSIDDPNEYVTLVIFLISGLATSVFGGLSREQLRNLRLREAQSQAALRLNDIVGGITREDEVIKLLDDELTKITSTSVVLFMLNEDKNIRKQSKEISGLSGEDRKFLKEVIDKEQPHKTTIIDKGSFHFEPIFLDTELIGVLAIEETKDMAHYMPRLYESLAKQCGLVLKNVSLFTKIESSKIREEKEQLRSALLSSVSHDLKTPLASIIGSLSAIHQMRDNLSKEDSDELLLTALEEAERLNGFISNILDMTKLESGAVKLNKNLIKLDDLISSVLKTLRFRTKYNKINFIKSPEVEINVDKLLFSQVLQNIIDNAVKYSPKDSEIKISAAIYDDQITICIADEGKGIEKKDRKKVFDKFSRLKKADQNIAGTGLGLSISKIIVEAHGGDINIEENIEAESGSVFKIILSEFKINKSLRVESHG